MRFLDFIRLSMSEPDKTPSSKRVVSYWVVFVYSTILLCGFFFGIAVSTEIKDMADMMLGAGLGTYVIGRYAEHKNKSVDKKDDSTGE